MKVRISDARTRIEYLNAGGWALGYLDNRPAVRDENGRWYYFPETAYLIDAWASRIWTVENGKWHVSLRDLNDDRKPDASLWTQHGPDYVDDFVFNLRKFEYDVYKVQVESEAFADTDYGIGYYFDDPAICDVSGAWYVVPDDTVVYNPAAGYVWYIVRDEWGDKKWESVPATDWDGEITDIAALLEELNADYEGEANLLPYEWYERLVGNQSPEEFLAGVADSEIEDVVKDYIENAPLCEHLTEAEKEAGFEGLVEYLRETMKEIKAERA